MFFFQRFEFTEQLVELRVGQPGRFAAPVFFVRVVEHLGQFTDTDGVAAEFGNQKGVVEQIMRLIRNKQSRRVGLVEESPQNSVLRRSNHDTDDKNG